MSQYFIHIHKDKLYFSVYTCLLPLSGCVEYFSAFVMIDFPVTFTVIGKCNGDSVEFTSVLPFQLDARNKNYFLKLESIFSYGNVILVGEPVLIHCSLVAPQGFMNSLNSSILTILQPNTVPNLSFGALHYDRPSLPIAKKLHDTVTIKFTDMELQENVQISNFQTKICLRFSINENISF